MRTSIYFSLPSSSCNIGPGTGRRRAAQYRYYISSHITENQPKTTINVSKVIPSKPTNSPHMVLHTSKVCKFIMQLITARWRILCVNRIALSPFKCCRPTVARPKELPLTPPDSAIVRARSRKLERMPNGSAHRHTASAPPPEGQKASAEDLAQRTYFGRGDPGPGAMPTALDINSGNSLIVT